VILLGWYVNGILCAVSCIVSVAKDVVPLLSVVNISTVNSRHSQGADIFKH
jgi:hypothetical protein